MSTFGFGGTPTPRQRPGVFKGGPEMPTPPLQGWFDSNATAAPAATGSTGQPFVGMSGVRRPAPPTALLPNYDAIPQSLIHRSLFTALQPFREQANAQGVFGVLGATPRQLRSSWIRDLLTTQGASGPLMQSIWELMFPNRGGPMDSANFARIFGPPQRGGPNFGAPTMEGLFQHLLSQSEGWYDQNYSGTNTGFDPSLLAELVAARQGPR